MRAISILVLLLAAGFLCLQCSQSTEPEPPAPVPDNPTVNLTAAEKSLVHSSSRFGLKLFREVVSEEEPGDNVFISPLSVSYALGMTYNGAAGATRDSMAATLEMAGLSVEEINKSYRNLTKILTGLDPKVVFTIANSIWYREGKPVRQTFIDLNKTYFDALVRQINFQAPWAADTINNWVDVHTNGKITEIIKPPIPPEVAMLLMNAVYFKGDWTHEFDTSDTYDGMFQLADGSWADCRMMMKEDTVKYFANDLLQAVDLPYGDGKFSMTILLPRPTRTVDDLMAELTEDNWALWLGIFADTQIPLSLPRFKFEYEVELKEMLKALGMGIAFDASEADFSNMFEDGVGWIDKVKHKTFVQVDERGTEAAAVTVVIIIDTAYSGMMVNRPFLFIVHEHDSGAILFMGKVADPVWVG